MHQTLIAVLSYKDLHYLRHSLKVVESLRKNLPADVVLLDAAHDDELRSFIKKKYPKFNYLRHQDGNIGYAKAYNEMLRLNPGHDFCLIYTSDVILDEQCVKTYLERMQADPSLMMCAGKMHYWDFKNNKKTKIIDTLGIMAQKRHHFYELGSGEEDKGQYDGDLECIFGISGAAFLFRTQICFDLYKKAHQIFDERMWMYKEDIDLAYRMRWLGAKIRIFPEVWGWHSRTMSNCFGHGIADLLAADRNKPDYGRKHSYKNHILMLKNHLSFSLGLGLILQVFLYETMKGIFIFLRHPKVFFAGMRTLLFVPARRSDKKASPNKIRNFFF